jgi:hypothetical protein
MSLQPAYLLRSSYCCAQRPWSRRPPLLYSCTFDAYVRHIPPNSPAECPYACHYLAVCGCPAQASACHISKLLIRYYEEPCCAAHLLLVSTPAELWLTLRPCSHRCPQLAAAPSASTLWHPLPGTLLNPWCCLLEPEGADLKCGAGVLDCVLFSLYATALAVQQKLWGTCRTHSTG